MDGGWNATILGVLLVVGVVNTSITILALMFLERERSFRATEREELYNQIRVLVVELTAATAEVRDLRAKSIVPLQPDVILPKLPTPSASETVKLVEHKGISILACIGDGPGLDRDLVALRKVRNRTKFMVDFRRIAPLKADILRDAVVRAQVNDAPYRYVHISAHMGDGFVQFTDGPVSAEWLRDVLVDCEVLVLAGCNSSTLANTIGGVVSFVVSIGGEVTHDDAVLFTEVFWEAIWREDSPLAAFNAARARCTMDVREFLDMRM